MILVVAVVCLLMGTYAHAGGKALAYGKHKIKGEHVDMAAVESLLDESTEPGYVEVGKSGKSIEKIKGKFPLDKSKPVEEAVLDFVDKHRNAYGLEHSKEELKMDKSSVDTSIGGGRVHYKLMHKGVSVWRKGLSAYYNKDGDIIEISSGLIPTYELEQINTTPAISEEEAIQYAVGCLPEIDRRRPLPRINKEYASVVIYNSKLAYWVMLKGNMLSWYIFIDAQNGKLLNSEDRMRYDGAVDATGFTNVQGATADS